MKTYHGDRTIDGIQVEVDGRPLDAGTSRHVYSENGFEWSYEGLEPLQLAFAILLDHTGDAVASGKLAQPFMQACVANFDNEWEMTSDDVAAALHALATTR